MEPIKFDELTKAIATATSRRQALKAIGAAVGGALGLGSIGTAFAAKNCKQLGQGCNNKKNLCCPGLICQGGICVAAPTTTTPAPTTTTTTPAPTTTTTKPPGLGCTAGSTCESACPDTSTPFCVCGTTMAGAPVCYLQQNGCPGQVCSTDADCGPGNACVNENDGCGGCDAFTGGKGICEPICTS